MFLIACNLIYLYYNINYLNSNIRVPRLVYLFVKKRAFSHKFIVNCDNTSSDSPIAVSRSRSVVKARKQCCISNKKLSARASSNFTQPAWGFLFLRECVHFGFPKCATPLKANVTPFSACYFFIVTFYVFRCHFLCFSCG